MNIEKLFDKRKKTRQKLRDNRELITWTKKLSKIINLVMTPILLGSLFLTIPLGLYFTDLFSAKTALYKLFPTGFLGFTATMFNIGVIIYSNIILTLSQLILKIKNKKLQNQLQEINKLIEKEKTSKKYIESKKENSLPKGKTKTNEYSYKYNPIIKLKQIIT